MRGVLCVALIYFFSIASGDRAANDNKRKRDSTVDDYDNEEGEREDYKYGRIFINIQTKEPISIRTTTTDTDDGEQYDDEFYNRMDDSEEYSRGNPKSKAKGRNKQQNSYSDEFLDGQKKRKKQLSKKMIRNEPSNSKQE
ncbi:hypothetical protein HK407_02g03140 [Ordospora pajunii]|uniref:uncharacterized protein n=1 Tax=Ordospora pajunii TaxID=3039483 RepID=UPI0029527EA4|nr:uncharacterized protein HK407_02g03140 [Ordospora pajunii]KAH9412090.1 hypothetical protein HK407_02g03140 [Ordospora pajunii]